MNQKSGLKLSLGKSLTRRANTGQDKFIPGQNLRYCGKGFAGFIKNQPYMVFISYYREHDALVIYNGINLVINRYHVNPVQ